MRFSTSIKPSEMGINDPVPSIGWDDFISRMDWEQGEHVTLVGHTGAGKTELTLRLLENRKYVVFLGTKAKDSTQDRLDAAGYKVVNDPTGINADVARHIIARPRFPKKSAAELKAYHTTFFKDAIMRVYRQGGWTLDIDEARYICDFLGLRDEVLLTALQGRSHGISIVASTQRPFHVPLELYDSATHLFFWRSSDMRNVKRVAELAGINEGRVIKTVQNLPKHDVLYVDSRTGEMFITNTRR